MTTLIVPNWFLICIVILVSLEYITRVASFIIGKKMQKQMLTNMLKGKLPVVAQMTPKK